MNRVGCETRTVHLVQMLEPIQKCHGKRREGDGYISVICYPVTACSFVLSFLFVGFPVEELLGKHEKEFFEVINPKHGLRTLIRTGVITEGVKMEIEVSSNLDGQEILYAHLKHHANEKTLRVFCEVAIQADGYPNMQEFGRKIMAELPQ